MVSHLVSILLVAFLLENWTRDPGVPGSRRPPS
jgi:hypothetical protein